MNKQVDIEDQDDNVVVIEQRDTKTYIYIVVAGVIGLALGALIGSTLTANKWESTYHTLEQRYKQVQTDKTDLVAKVELKVASVDQELEEKMQLAIEQEREEYAEKIAQLETQLSEIEKVNVSLEEQVAEQKKQISDADVQNVKLNRQADMQVTMFERSREVFQREVKVKQDLAALEAEKTKLLPILDNLKKQCDVYLAGTSWDANSDSCDKQDEASSRISQINQMIQVHNMDLKQLEALIEELGL